MTSFNEDVYSVTKQIPKGSVSTYKLIAEAIGNPKSFRAVGRALSINPYAPKVPCHRVILSNGKIGGFFGEGDIQSDNVKKKIEILSLEGITIDKNGRVDNFLSVLFKPEKMVCIEFED